MSERPSSLMAATIAANRFGLGARPGDIGRIGADARSWLRDQLRGGTPQVVPPRSGADSLRDSRAILVDAIELREDRRKQRAAGEVTAKLGSLYKPVYVAETTARWRTAFETARPFLERLVHFWANHFAVSVDKLAVLGIAGAFEREAIRPHVLGDFASLLLAVERHPAMLLYLDNHVSVGPESVLAQRAERRAGAKGKPRRTGLNENLAREILELHTLGVDGGYTQADVTAFAKVLTGWSIGGGRGRLASGTPGVFTFRAEQHEPGAQTIVGRRYAESGVEQGEAVLRRLATEPATARHLATKLARHFIADEPPARAIERIAAAWLDSRGDLPIVYRALVDAPESWEPALAKFKTPAEFICSTWRALDVPPESGPRALAAFELLGQRTWSPGSPAGWPDRSVDWDGSSALLKRIEWADAVAQRLGDRRSAQRLAPDVLGVSLTPATSTAIAHAASASQALTLWLSSPEFMRR